MNESMSCKTENVIYVLFCNNCPKTYIGETGQKLCTRTAEHRCHILNAAYRKLEVSHHVFECAGHLPIPFCIMPIFKMPLNCTQIERESKELFFQKKILSFFAPWSTHNPVTFVDAFLMAYIAPYNLPLFSRFFASFS